MCVCLSLHPLGWAHFLCRFLGPQLGPLFLISTAWFRDFFKISNIAKSFITELWFSAVPGFLFLPPRTNPGHISALGTIRTLLGKNSVSHEDYEGSFSVLRGCHYFANIRPGSLSYCCYSGELGHTNNYYSQLLVTISEALICIFLTNPPTLYQNICTHNH